MDDGTSGQSASGSDLDYVALPPGTKIGRYEVLAVLGQGGFGITYRARDLQLNRDVAIKEYLPSSIAIRRDGVAVLPRSAKVAEDFAWGRDRFVAEGQTLASLHHAPGIVRVFDFLEINGTAYIVMEMLRGDTLEARIKSGGPLDGAAVERILWTLLDGLEQVHAAGFLHRDIKPANILLDARGSPTLIDFGASRAAMAGRTTAMTAIFTPAYAATEQMSSARQGPCTDIYALSATLYHAITGKAPPNAFDRMLDDDYEPVGRLAVAGFPAGILAGIDAGLAVRAAERPQSIAGWRALLSTAPGAESDATVLVRQPPLQPPLRPTIHPTIRSAIESPPPTPVARPPARGRSSLHAGVAAVALLLAGGGAWLALSSGTPEAPASMKAEDGERARAAAAASRQAAPATAPAAGAGLDGTYAGALPFSLLGAVQTRVRIDGATGAGTLSHPRCGTAEFSLRIAPSGAVSGSGSGFDDNCGSLPVTLTGKVGGGRLELTMSGPGFNSTGTLAPGQ